MGTLALLAALAACDARAAEAPLGPAQVEAVRHEGRARVHARLFVHPDDRVGSAPVRTGVLLEMDPGWHVYAPNPGDTGLPTELRWRAEDGWVEPVRWPEPETFREAGGLLTTYGYAERVLLPTRVHFEPSGASTRRLRVEVSLLACSVECIPARFTLEREAGARIPDAAKAEVRALFAGNTPQPAASRGSASLALLLALAFLGGLVLNLMPCVLPVLAIKVAGLAELGAGDRRRLRAHGAAYAAGVLASLLALAATVVGLREAGRAVGWGFQFQEPIYLAAVSAVLVLFALNLFGLFEIGTPAALVAGLGERASGLARSFFEGLLAVVLATPCSAPFLGTATGFAFAAAPAATFAIFGAIALGLASPFVLITWVPAWARLLPRSGAWMLRLRAALGFALLATVVWLCWLLGRTAGADAQAQLLAGLVALSLGAWIHAQLGRRMRRRAVLAGGMLLTLLVAGNRIELGRAGAASEPIEWHPYRREAVARHVAAGGSALVVFTADWCITCKVNERFVLESPAVARELERRRVRRYRADWTRRDDALREELARFGRAGVPLTVLYPPGRPHEPRVLPELLRTERVLAALARLPDGEPEVSLLTHSRPQSAMKDAPAGRGTGASLRRRE